MAIQQNWLMDSGLFLVFLFPYFNDIFQYCIKVVVESS